MKKAAVLLIVLLSIGASHTEVRSFDTEIRINQEVSLDNDNLRIKFIRVVEDRRCPKFFKCTWSGYVKVEIVVTVGKTDYGAHFISDINNESYNLTNVISVSSYKIKLVGVSRAKNIKSKVNTDDYVIQLVVTDVIRE